ncbi:MAG: Na+:solute symporter [Myxococcales bacterium]|nr:Na+:solute symporter [Myxococcales bacterium]
MSDPAAAAAGIAAGALNTLDAVIIGVTLLASLTVGLAMGRRGTSSLSNYLVAGRKLPWWLAGTSIVATSFAADTPLAIARIVRTRGLSGNWYWWSGAIAFAACMFFFAPLWQRSRLLTDAELLELRYAGRPAATLRGLQGSYRAIIANGVTMGWVLLGMRKIADAVFGWPPTWTIVALVILALIYTWSAGLWGVVVTDLLQFTLAMIGSVALAAIVLHDLGGPAALAAKATAAADGPGLAGSERLLSWLPSGDVALATFGFYVLVQWWGGAEGGGFLVQRLFATRDERHAALALLWFTVAHFVLRTWPWLIVGIASVVVLPQLADPELAYPIMMVRYLPHGLLGLMVASLLAAFLSTVSTHLNWGASYLVNDLWRRFFRPDATDEAAISWARMSVIAMAALAGAVAWQMDSILSAWFYLAELGAGAALIGLSRWLWWRINAWGEVAALITSLLAANLLRLVPWLEGDNAYPIRFGIVLALGTAAGLVTSLSTRPTPDATLDAFYKRVRPWGWWRPVAQRNPDVQVPEVGRKAVVGWLLTVISIYAALFGVGEILLGQPLIGTAGCALAVLTGGLLWRVLRRYDFGVA